MAYDVVRPLIHEVLTMVNNAKVKNKKIEVLRKYKSNALKMVLKSSFDPKIVWRIPDGDVPFKKNDAPEGTCLLYTSPSPRDQRGSRMPSSA